MSTCLLICYNPRDTLSDLLTKTGIVMHATTPKKRTPRRTPRGGGGTPRTPSKHDNDPSHVDASNMSRFTLSAFGHVSGSRHSPMGRAQGSSKPYVATPSTAGASSGGSAADPRFDFQGPPPVGIDSPRSPREWTMSRPFLFLKPLPTRSLSTMGI